MSSHYGLCLNVCVLLMRMNSNVTVHSHVRNMSIAGVIPRRGGMGVGVGVDGGGGGGVDKNDKESKEAGGGGNGKGHGEAVKGSIIPPAGQEGIKERSPLADLLYLRCE